MSAVEFKWLLSHCFFADKSMNTSDRCTGSMSPFCLGMAEFNCCGVSVIQENAKGKEDEPKTKRLKLSLSKRCFEAAFLRFEAKCSLSNIDVADFSFLHFRYNSFVLL